MQKIGKTKETVHIGTVKLRLAATRLSDFLFSKKYKNAKLSDINDTFHNSTNLRKTSHK